MGSRRTKSQSAVPTHGTGLPAAFTLIELLVVIAIIALLTSIALPVFGSVRRKVKHLQNKNNMRLIPVAMELYGTVNDDNCPPTLGEIHTKSGVTGSDPRYLIVPDTKSSTRYRALSEYLGGDYIPNAKTMYCPNAPKFQYLQKMWDAGNAWDHPTEGTPRFPDSFKGAYCFWWNYEGYLPQNGRRFKGPKTITGGNRESKVMVTDYFGRNHWRAPISTSDTDPPPESRTFYGSCEPFKHATRTDSYFRAADYWRSSQPSSDMWNTPLLAGLIDGSVIEYTPAEAGWVQVLNHPQTLSNAVWEGPGRYGDYAIPPVNATR